MINNQRVFSIFNHKMISQWPSKMNVSRWLETTLRCWSFYQQNWGIVRGCPWHFLEERSLPAPNLAETLFVGGMIFLILNNFQHLVISYEHSNHGRVPMISHGLVSHGSYPESIMAWEWRPGFFSHASETVGCLWKWSSIPATWQF